ncbi:hypothetical protein ACEPAH_2587 [Sanghuangporus vaninii]
MIDSRRAPPFSYNDLHDLESLWWIAIWKLFNNVDHGEEDCRPRSEKQDDRRESAAAKLFSGCNEIVNRKLFIQVTDIYYDELAWMPECLHDVKFILDSLRIELVLSYQKFEATFPSARTQIIDGVHDEFQKQFAKCMDCRNDAKLEPHRDIDVRSRSFEKDFVNQSNSVSRIQHAVQAEDNVAGSALRLEEEGLMISAGHASDPSTRERKRKRDSEDFIGSVHPHRKARYEAKVF